MKKEDKNKAIELMVEQLANNKNFYLTDTSSLTVDSINKLRRMCFNKKIHLQVVKNTLLKKAMEKQNDAEFKPLYASLKGATAIMFCESASEPAKVIQEFRKTKDKPLLKAAFVEQSAYLGDNELAGLASIKSKEELIGDIIGLLQSPAKNVISALQSGKNTIAGVVKTLSEKK
ncbi:MAG TPA: 50S ribosomal protein L10 [Bacteroidia bacterium]|nr:50S ribosomal protein L10 [Bacteroidia bacterium]